MEIVVLVGIPGSGKSTLSKQRFSDYTRINLDTLHTRRNEDREISRCLENRESFVVDNTNTTRRSRSKYIRVAKSFGIPVRAVFFNCPLDLALSRNALRVGREFVPERAVRMYNRILEPPTIREGFQSVEVI